MASSDASSQLASIIYSINSSFVTIPVSSGSYWAYISAQIISTGSAISIYCSINFIRVSAVNLLPLPSMPTIAACIFSSVPYSIPNAKQRASQTSTLLIPSLNLYSVISLSFFSSFLGFGLGFSIGLSLSNLCFSSYSAII